MTVHMDQAGRETAALAELVPSFEQLRVLEVGCGNGRLTRRYADRAAYVLAIDPDEGAIERFRRTMPKALDGRVELRVAALEAIEASDAAFDIVLFAWSL